MFRQWPFHVFSECVYSECVVIVRSWEVAGLNRVAGWASELVGRWVGGEWVDGWMRVSEWVWRWVSGCIGEWVRCWVSWGVSECSFTSILAPMGLTPLSVIPWRVSLMLDDVNIVRINDVKLFQYFVLEHWRVQTCNLQTGGNKGAD